MIACQDIGYFRDISHFTADQMSKICETFVASAISVGLGFPDITTRPNLVKWQHIEKSLSQRNLFCFDGSEFVSPLSIKYQRQLHSDGILIGFIAPSPPCPIKQCL